MRLRDATIVINGQNQAVRLPCTIAQLLDRAGVKATQVVIEHNGDVLPKAEVSATFLEEGDRLEVIVPVAGG
jgi:thiamine biosynthesis protein ThiS